MADHHSIRLSQVSDYNPSFVRVLLLYSDILPLPICERPSIHVSYIESICHAFTCLYVYLCVYVCMLYVASCSSRCTHECSQSNEWCHCCPRFQPTAAAATSHSVTASICIIHDQWSGSSCYGNGHGQAYCQSTVSSVLLLSLLAMCLPYYLFTGPPSVPHLPACITYSTGLIHFHHCMLQVPFSTFRRHGVFFLQV